MHPKLKDILNAQLRIVQEHTGNDFSNLILWLLDQKAH